ncbi:MAG: hypothetical protein UT21_C0012G0004 [Candidatus Woesebacteria bacterium GW2011_GWA1_39_11b]|nr:MAG: hypothetical protein UT21_C0012G0004 [Candidatus Woesebacteria bacterium GW2011_GWA1_39_11b]
MKLNLSEAEISNIEFNYYYQDSDSCESNNCGQQLVIKTDDAGGGPFIIIETERWAIDSDGIDDFCDVLKNIVRIVEDSKVVR